MKILINHNHRIMKYSIIILFNLISFSFFSVSQNKLAVTYTANQGYVVESEGHKIATDVFFDKIDGIWCDSPTEEVLFKMKNAEYPFNDIDLITVSHKHIDHFNANVLLNHLISSSKPVVICPKQVKDILSEYDSYEKIKGRIYGIELKEFCDSSLIVSGIPVRVMRLEHSHFMEEDTLTGEMKNRHENIQNFGYIFDLEGKKIFHSGDANPLNDSEFRNYFDYDDGVDLAFIDRLFFSRGNEVINMVNDIVKPKNIVLMHIKPKNQALFAKHFKEEENIKIFEQKQETIIIVL